MSHIETVLDKAAVVKYCCEFDMTLGYWHLLLHEECHECKLLTSSDEIFTPARLLHKTLSANSHLHAGLMSAIPSDSKEKLLILVNDIMIAVKDVNDVLEYITKLFFFCGDKFKISFHQMSLIQNSDRVVWAQCFSQRYQIWPTLPFRSVKNHNFNYC